MADRPSRTERGGASPTADRLAARAQRGALKRVSMPGGGEVFQGAAASRSLDALGARAMTVDRSIIVADDFDSSKPEDQALFAHEMHHVEHSGGVGSGESRDAEEVAARAVERMVLHRARAGGVEGHEASHAVPGGGSTGGGVSSGPSPAGGEDDPAQRGYESMRAEGLSHADIVDKLAREVLAGLDGSRDSRFDRAGDVTAWR